ncbi:helix-turn-helix domain-containing protein, partial [Micrococcus luteus]|uniref:TetR/AcrR family transcriptional regulator n=1 Tax=Micrococcus luteus TaxID=1270 RepID=UPI0034187FD1
MPTRRQQQGENSRELILDATERLMATKGYAATSISDIRRACGLPASSIYWHFGSKEGVLAAVMERGAERFFGAIPRHGDTSDPPDVEVQLAATAKLLGEHPDFLRLVYLLGLERTDDPAVGAAVRRVR